MAPRPVAIVRLALEADAPARVEVAARRGTTPGVTSGLGGGGEARVGAREGARDGAAAAVHPRLDTAVARPREWL